MPERGDFSPARRSRIRIGFGPGSQQVGDGFGPEVIRTSRRIAISPRAGSNPLHTTWSPGTVVYAVE